MAINSRLIQINDWALLEFDYLTDVISTSDSNFYVINNKYKNYNQIISEDSSYKLTGNVLDYSVSQLGNRKFVAQDRDIATPYLEFDSVNLPKTEIKNLTNLNWNVKYDTVRLHILSGYNFDNSDGIIIEILYPEKNKIKKTVISQYLHLKGESNIKFSSKSLYIAGRFFDKYLEFKIPSLAWLVNEFESNIENTNEELSYYMTSDNSGFDTEGLIYFNIYDIESRNLNNGHEYLTTSNVYESSLTQQDQYSNLSCIIKESEEFDYFEYYPMWEGGFINDYIGALNAVKGNYIVIHELVVYEQIGFDETITDKITTLQEYNFDTPSLFRPVIKNSDVAYSFSIDYIMRLTDRNSGSQIIRRSSLTSTNPKKYGKKLLKLNINEQLTPHRIVNKLTKGQTINIAKLEKTKKIEKILYPIFFEKTNISTSITKLFINDNTLLPDELYQQDIIFGQSQGLILISPFDNFFKFKLYKINNNSITSFSINDIEDIDIIFTDSKNKNISRISKYIYKDINSYDELLFKIPSQEAQKILQNENGLFYINHRTKNLIRAKISLQFYGDIRGKEVLIPYKEFSTKSENDTISVFVNNKQYDIQKRLLTTIEIIPNGNSGEETIIYNGKWSSVTEYDKYLNYINTLKNNDLSIKIASLKEKEFELNNTKLKLDAKEVEITNRENRLKNLELSLGIRQKEVDSIILEAQKKQKEIDSKNNQLSLKEKELLNLQKDININNTKSLSDLEKYFKDILKEVETIKKSNINDNRPTTTTNNSDNNTNNNANSNNTTNNTNNNKQGTQGIQGIQSNNRTKNLNDKVSNYDSNNINKTKLTIPIVKITDIPFDNKNDFSHNINKMLVPIWNNSVSNPKNNINSTTDINNIININTINTSSYTVHYELYLMKDGKTTAKLPIKITDINNKSIKEYKDIFNKFISDNRSKSGYNFISHKSESIDFSLIDKLDITWSIHNNSNINNGNIKQKVTIYKIISPKKINSSEYTTGNLSIDSIYKNDIELEIIKDSLYDTGKKEYENNKKSIASVYYNWVNSNTLETYTKEIIINNINTTNSSSTEILYSDIKFKNYHIYGIFNDLIIELQKYTKQELNFGIIQDNININNNPFKFDSLPVAFEKVLNNPTQYRGVIGDIYANTILKIKNSLSDITNIINYINNTSSNNSYEKTSMFVQLKARNGTIGYLPLQEAKIYINDVNEYKDYNLNSMNTIYNKSYPSQSKIQLNSVTFDLLNFYELTDYVFNLNKGTTYSLFGNR